MNLPMSRLHITPLRPELLSVVLGAELSQIATEVSYHHIQTDSANDFGYVTLPGMEAERIKKKLNGAIVKGQKVKIEEARPLKRRHNETEEDTANADGSTVTSLPKKAKKEKNSLSAHELSPDRKVKRGWTEPKEKKIREKKDKKDKKEKTAKTQMPSKYTDQEELLFRTKIPPNKSSENRKRNTKQGEKSDGSEVVHEFKKTTVMPSFLRGSVDGARKPASEYRDGKGWVDADGNVIEPEGDQPSGRRKAARLGLGIDVTKAEASNLKRSQNTPLSPPSSVPASLSGKPVQEVADDETSSSGASSPSGESQSSGSDSDTESEEQNKTAAESEPQPPTIVDETSQPTVHPLEALFKKPKLPTITTTGPDNQTLSLPTTASTGSGKTKPTLELTTSFSFFGNQEDSEDETEAAGSKSSRHVITPHLQKPQIRQLTQRIQTPHDNDISHELPTMPLTPFSTADFHIRRMRSAAPTPDTGDIRKSTGYGSLILGEDDPNDVLSDGEDQPGHPNGNMADTTNQNQHAQSEFEKKFWQQRGDNNRAWKARRRAVLKEKRQRENRARRPRTF